METTTTTREDVYTRVTNQIIEQLERGTRPWFQPWSVKHAAGSISRPLRHGGEPYQGVNVLMLWMAAHHAGFVSPYWLTFRQCQELKGHVKKGEKGTTVVYASIFQKKGEASEDGEPTEEQIPFLKAYQPVEVFRRARRRLTHLLSSA